MHDLDIKFRPNTLIGPTITIDDMFKDGYEALFVGTGVFAAGDVVSGARTVVEAVAATKLVAEEIEEYIKNNY